MRIDRVRLRNYRGVADCDVRLLPPGAEAGVTVVCGPNEAGKTSLADAVRHALDFHDSSKAQEIKDLQPVGSDLGTEIELEMRSGPYALTYRKRFNKERGTHLDVTAPRVEQLSGREAHDRVRAILDETIDVALWEALWVRQGGPVGQAAVADAPGLSRALAGADGATAIGDRETALHERVRDEYLRYFTRTGQEGKALKDAESRRAEAAAALAAVEGELEALESDIERVGELEASLPELRAHVAKAEQEARERAGELGRVAGLEREVAGRRAELETAAAAAERVRQRATRREELREQLDEASARLDGLRDEAEADGAALRTADDDHAATREQAEAAERDARAADDLLALRRADVEALRQEEDLTELRKRQDRVRAERVRIDDATDVIDGIAVDDASLGRIRALHLDVERATVALEAGSPTVTVAADAPLSVHLDDEAVELAAGETLDRAVGSRLRVAAPGLGSVTVDAGKDTEELLRAHEQALRALGDALDRAGVQSAEEAEQAARTRREAEASLAEARRARDDALGDLDAAGLDERITLLERRVEAYQADRDDAPAMAQSVSEARESLGAAEEAAEEAAARREDAVAAQQRARDRLEALREAQQQRQVDLRVAEREAARFEEQLSAERERESDEALLAAVEEATAAQEAARQAVSEAEQRLADADPDTVRTLADNAAAALDDARTRVRDCEGDLRELRAMIGVRGGDGLFDRVGEQRAACEEAEADCADLRRRAAAARLLKESFDTSRDAARQRYVGPLRDRIVGLGRLLTPGRDFDVELDEQLRISRRILDGTALAFDALSDGAKEQLSLIGRVACALLVAEDDGAPLIIDDALGYSDESRLRSMGAVLRQAGSSLQVVVLTCYPDRYRHIGGAHWVDLPAPARAAGAAGTLMGTLGQDAGQAK